MLQIILGFLASLVVLFVPGLLLGFAIGLKRLWLFALAPLISLTILSGAAVVLPFVGLTWSPLGILAFAAVFGLLVTTIFRFALRTRFTFDTVVWRGTAPALLLATVILMTQFALAVGPFSGISQTFDNVFHLNAIKHVTVSGQASPLTIGGFTSPDTAPSFYPGMWHAGVQLVQQLSGSTIPVAINVFNMALMATVWPLGVLVLARGFTGASRLGVWVAALLAVSFPAFPLFMLQYGVLYPYFMGLTLLPAVLALVLNLLRVTLEQRITTVLPQLVLLAGVLPGLMMAHPQAMMGVLALTVPAAVVATFAGFTKLIAAKRAVRLVLLAGFGAGGYFLLWKLRPTNPWEPRMSMGEALQQTLLLQLWGYGLPVLLAAVTIFGVIRAFVPPYQRTKFAALGIWAVGASLFLVSAGVPYRLFRIPVQVWYSDAPRLASLFVIALLPILALTLTALLEKLAAKFPLLPFAKALFLAVFFIVSISLAGFGQMFADTRGTYAMDAESPLLSSDEAALLEEVDEIVPADDVVVGSPWTGASLSYAFAEREALLPHMFMGEFSPERSLVTEHLDEAAAGNEICAAVQELRSYWVLDFGPREVHGAEHIYPGFDTFPADKFELVKQVGEAKLYRVTACN